MGTMPTLKRVGREVEIDHGDRLECVDRATAEGLVHYCDAFGQPERAILMRRVLDMFKQKQGGQHEPRH